MAMWLYGYVAIWLNMPIWLCLCGPAAGGVAILFCIGWHPEARIPRSHFQRGSVPYKESQTNDARVARVACVMFLKVLVAAASNISCDVFLAGQERPGDEKNPRENFKSIKENISFGKSQHVEN